MGRPSFLQYHSCLEGDSATDGRDDNRAEETYIVKRNAVALLCDERGKGPRCSQPDRGFLLAATAGSATRCASPI